MLKSHCIQMITGIQILITKATLNLISFFLNLIMLVSFPHEKLLIALGTIIMNSFNENIFSLFADFT